MQNLGGGGGGGGKQGILWDMFKWRLKFTFHIRPFRVAPSLFFKANKTDYSHFLEKGFALRGLGLKLTVFVTWKWPQLYDLFFFRQSFCPTLFKRHKAFGFHFYLGRIECLMIRRCNML